jgi:hypothetical protein
MSATNRAWKIAREIVLQHISEGLNTAQELQDATGFTQYQTSTCLQQLKKRGKVRNNNGIWNIQQNVS